MAGHSKWSKIHRKKGVLDQKRGKIFGKLSKEIYLAAKEDQDPESNAQLRLVLEKAKAQNMPKDNIQKALDKAKGPQDGVSYDEIRYEGYGPNGFAVMVDCVTDNRNRTAAQVRAAFTKHKGNLGTDGSVNYLFKKKGLLEIKKIKEEDEVFLISIDAGALDFINTEDVYQVVTTPEDFISVKEKLEKAGITQFESAEVTYIADNEIELTEEELEKAFDLIDALEDLDDVSVVYSNIK